MAEFARYTVGKLAGTEPAAQPCFDPVGSLEVATTEERWADLHRKHGWASFWGVEGARLVNAAECSRLHPLLEQERLRGGLYVASDGLANAVQAGEELARRATSRGARFLGGQTVLDVLSRSGRVTGVVSGSGTVPADLVVLCAGFWGAEIGRMVDLTVPLLPMAHRYALTGSVPPLLDRSAGAARLPIVRHQEADLYYRVHGDRIGIGYYGHQPLPVDVEGLGRTDGSSPMPSMLPFTERDFEPAWADTLELLPALADTQVQEGVNGIFSVTPDGAALMGEHRDLSGPWVAEAVWVTHSAGVARAMAERMVEGRPRTDVHECDLYRFEGVQLTPEYVEVRSAQNFVAVYDILHPLQPPEQLRPLRTSPVYPRHQELGAVFLEGGAWERPRWFEANALHAATCMYSNTADQHFVVAAHPGHDNVTVACGFSGHRFKFVPVIGEVLADLAMTGRTDNPIGVFDPRREAHRVRASVELT